MFDPFKVQHYLNYKARWTSMHAYGILYIQYTRISRMFRASMPTRPRAYILLVLHAFERVRDEVDET